MIKCDKNVNDISHIGMVIRLLPMTIWDNILPYILIAFPHIFCVTMAYGKSISVIAQNYQATLDITGSSIGSQRGLRKYPR